MALAYTRVKIALELSLKNRIFYSHCSTNHMNARIVYLTFSLLFLIVGTAQGSLIASVSPDSGNLEISRDKESYIKFWYFDWGPGWTGVKRKKTVQELKDSAEFNFDNELRRAEGSFNVQGKWSLSDENKISFDAVLKPNETTNIVMAQISLAPGKRFRSTQASIVHADGSTTSLPIPIRRNTIGEKVTAIKLTDSQGLVTKIQFSDPTSIVADRAARIQIAKDQINKAEEYRLSFEVTFSEPVLFVPGKQAASEITSNAGWYEFNPPGKISPKSKLRIDDWLDKPAGEHGRIIRDGDKLTYNGTEIKLWGINNSHGACAPDKELARKRADFYAAMGINSVRLHKYGEGYGWAGILKKNTIVEFDPRALDRMDYYVAELKKRGIYITLSPVFLVNIGVDDKKRIPYMEELGKIRRNQVNGIPGSLYLSIELQDLLIEQVQKLLRHVNPYTGLTYGQDPAIAYVELYNEDSALFFGLSKAMSKSETLRNRGSTLFFNWLKKKYGTKQAFEKAWGSASLNSSIIKNQKLPTDESWEQGRIYPAGNPWFYDPENLNGSQKRIRRRLLDTMAFLYELQNSVYTRYTNAVREAGYEGELIFSNWKAGRMMSHYYNLHSDSLAGTVDRHNYFGGANRRSSLFQSASMLSQVGSGILSSSLQQVKNHPFMVSEWIHVFPNEWGVEGPAIIGAYGMGFQGWDASYPFQNRDSGSFSSAIGSQRWQATAPHFLGIFPAVSRQVLRGDVKESKVVHDRNIHVPSLDSQKIHFDETIQSSGDIKSYTSDVFPAAAIAAAKGVVTFTEKLIPTEKFDLDSYTVENRINSSTGQLAWTNGANTQDGYIEINTKATQAVVGFAQNKSIELKDSTITPRSRFGAIYLTALSKSGTLNDDQILLSAISRARNKEQIVVDDSILFSIGRLHKRKPAGPVVMEPVKAEINLKRGGTPTVHLLDHGGVKTGKTLKVVDGTITIDTGRDSTPYYLIEFP